MQTSSEQVQHQLYTVYIILESSHACTSYLIPPLLKHQ